MKKLICALVLLAMLVPVAAMAENKLPDALTAAQMSEKKVILAGKEISLEVDIQGYKVRYRLNLHEGDTTYTAFYYLTGALESSTVSYGHGPEGPSACAAIFSATGVEKKVDRFCNESHDFTAPTSVKLDFSDDAIIPEANVLDVAKKYGWNESYEAFREEIVKAYNTNITISGKRPGIEPVGNMGFDMSYMGGSKQFAHFGPIAYGNHPSNGTRLRVYGYEYKNILSWADYDLGTGELDHYGIFTEDGRMETVYSAKNVLISTEIWTDDGAYWRYEGDDWLYSAEGDPESDGWGATPTAEVLEMITLSPRIAKFDVAKASSANADLGDAKGTPVVVGSVNAHTEAEMLDAHTSKYEMKVSGGGSLPETISLLLPYGPGQNQEIAKNFTYTVEHKHDNGKVDNYSTEPTKASEMTIAFTENGVLVSGVSSFSPFTVEWGPKQASTVGMDSLPSTGDSSNLLAYACLLLSSAAALYMISKRRAHQ